MSRPRWLKRALLLLVSVATLWGLGTVPRSAAAENLGPPEPIAVAPAEEAIVHASDAPVVTTRRISRPQVPENYNVYDGGWIRFAYPPSVRQRIEPLIAEANEIRAELSSRFERDVLADVDVRIARTPGEMATLSPPGAPFPRYASGVAYSQIGLVLLTLQPHNAGAPHDLVEVFHHELAHVALHETVDNHHVPRWFNEGFAIHLSGESSLARLQTLWGATLGGTLLPLDALDRAFPSEDHEVSVAYAQSADVVRHLLRTLSCACGVSPSSASCRACSTQP
jgi:hypothetical protein